MITSVLTLKHRETHGCVVSIVATDALVLKHQAISILSADQTFIVLDQFHMEIFHLCWTTFGNRITYWKKISNPLRVKVSLYTSDCGGNWLEIVICHEICDDEYSVKD